MILNNIFNGRFLIFTHKRRYHMYSDVLIGSVLCIWLSNWNFFLSKFILSRVRWKICRGEFVGVHRLRAATQAAPSTSVKFPQVNFQAKPKNIKISDKSANYQPNPLYQQKKRHYLHNIIHRMLILIIKLKSAETNIE